ncbi:peptidoglycan-binding domain-containing protein [Xanthobacter sp. 126]|uniref:peptidoglycan-binding domain-containing protein n=1 Tax=Xanthobacter sp. 126 TaxID=1131814 RepID=UPI00045E7A71|nr:peptidoglycan-binding domain-containing protein [Xanthobacter sp. 126]
MKLETATANAAPPELAEAAKAEETARQARRLRRMDVMAALVALAGSAAFLANVLVLQTSPPSAPLPMARPAGAGKVNHTTVPLTATGTGTATTSTPAGGATTGSLGYLSIRTSVTGTAAPLVPATGARTADARGEPPPSRPPAGLVSSGDITGAVRPPVDVGASPRILSVQKALSKLGYGPIKVDGRPGGETRAAIVRFQRDRNLTADGEITDKLVRELGSVSGMALN